MVSVRAPNFALVPIVILAGAGCSPNGSSASSAFTYTAEPSSGGSVASTSKTGSDANMTGGSSSATNVGGNSSSTAAGGSNNTGGASAIGGTSSASVSSSNTGGRSSTGGAASAGGTSALGGSRVTGGSSSTGGSKAATGSTATGGNSGTGGSKATGGTSSNVTGGSAATGGSNPTGGSNATGGSSANTGSCSINVTASGVSSKMATVGTVDWSTSANVSSANIVYTLDNPGSNINKGGTAPVDLTKSNYHTLLLGLKQSSKYTAHVEAKLSDGSTCTGEDFTISTGSLSGAPNITRTVTNASASADGFIVTSGGMTGSGAFIIDADGAVVWYAAAPNQCSRAHMDYEGVNMWMLSLNVMNSGGEMRYVSMDGQDSKSNISGLSSAHHDFTVIPGKIAAMVWASNGSDPESNLVEIASDGSGSPTTKFKIGANLYNGGSSALGAGGSSFHSNSILYHPSDDSFTIGDRNPNLYVKVTHSGSVQWQFGGSDCSNAPAGSSHCVTGNWKVNHGQHLLDNGNFLIFNNGQSGSSHVFEYKLSTSGTMSATLVKDFTSGSTSSNVLGDVQRLPNGNTLVTYSVAGQIIEVDSSWSTVQTFKANFGYSDWRETLYGPPPR